MSTATICSDAALQRLEYPRLKVILAGMTQSEPGRLLAERLLPSLDDGVIVTALDEVDEAVRFLHDGQSPGLGGGRDIASVVEQARAVGSLVAIEDLQKVAASLRVTEDCRRWFRDRSAELALAQVAATILPLGELQRHLQDSIGTRGELLDSASFELGDLRYRIRQVRSRIKQQLDQLLTSEQYASCFQERLITERNGRYVVPLKADCRGQIKGFVQDESASGQTLYLEPTRVLDDNNHLQQLLREEQREVQRILLQLSDLVRRDGRQLLSNQAALSRIDLRFAAARLSRAFHGCRPELVSEPVIEVKQARHPLLLEKDGRIDPVAAVAIDLLMPSGCRALVISGPNTGGKSVALKTTGLLLLMLRSGLHVPCHPDSRMHLFRSLHVDIGDEQSIAESLSTFSGHLVKIRNILEVADAETLVLLDEAGSGTDPAEGAALIQAVLEHLCRQGACAMVTTHLGQLKHFAYGHPQIENAAVEFDPETLAPTYRLSYGIPGASSALATARRLGLPQLLLERAEEFIGREERDHSRLLAELHTRQQALEQQLREARQARSQAEAAQQLRRGQLQQLKEKKRDILGRATRQAEELINSTQTRMKQLRKRSAPTTPQDATAEKALLQEAREELTPFKPRRKRRGTTPEVVQTGELVRIVALGVEAEVVRASGTNVDLLVSGKRMRQPLSALEQFEPRRFVEAKPARKQVSRQLSERHVSTQLKLVGERGEDAVARLGPFVDDALLHGLDKVEIIHGSGAGILRRLVREFLAEHRGVSAFYAAPAELGGENVTIVELGDK